ncbi:hypothetical protein [Clostridium sp. OS1-26]|nr:hypothetical protein [Clostridium sp. OS1-26]WML33219.1 hypothetical protein RCG18_17935 [Clostridium sp. OS1-26]
MKKKKSKGSDKKAIIQLVTAITNLIIALINLIIFMLRANK